MVALLYTEYALLALALLFLAAQRCRDGPTPAACVSIPIAAGLCYDNVVLALGGALLAGPLLLALNWPRYLLQALIAPLFLLSFADVYRRAGAAGLSARAAQRLALAAALALMGYGLAGLGALELVPLSGWGITRYVSASTSPPVIGVAVALAALATGAAIWRVCGWPWLAWTALAMLIGCGASTALGRDGVCLVTNAAELLLLATVLAGTRYLRLGHCRVSPPHHGVSVRRNL